MRFWEIPEAFQEIPEDLWLRGVVKADPTSRDGKCCEPVGNPRKPIGKPKENGDLRVI